MKKKNHFVDWKMRNAVFIAEGNNANILTHTGYYETAFEAKKNYADDATFYAIKEQVWAIREGFAENVL